MKKWFGSVLAGLFLSFSAWATVDLNGATQSELEAVKGIGLDLPPFSGRISA